MFEKRIEEFMRWRAQFPIKFFRGSEVYINDQIIKNIKKYNLTVNNSSYVFVELPADNVMTGVSDLFYQIMIDGHIPIISHPERNTVFARRAELLFELISVGALAQVTAKSILGEFGREARRAAKVFS
jgi:protein-tyrosine phosphatase